MRRNSAKNELCDLTRPDAAGSLHAWRGPIVLLAAGLAVLIGYAQITQSIPARPTKPAERNINADVERDMLLADPKNHLAHYNLGLRLQSQGDLPAAIAHYEKAIAIESNDPRYHNNLAAASAEQGRLGEAISHFERAIELEPGNAEAHFNLGNALFSQQQHQSAIRQYRRALDLNPEHAKAHNNLAVALKETGNLQEAYKHRHEAMRLQREQRKAK